METKLDQELEKARLEVARLEAKKEKADREAAALTETQKFAVTLHEKLCHHDHTEYCSWYYRDLKEPQTWTGQYSVHKDYLEKAERILQVTDKETALKVLEAI